VIKSENGKQEKDMPVKTAKRQRRNWALKVNG